MSYTKKLFLLCAEFANQQRQSSETNSGLFKETEWENEILLSKLWDSKSSVVIVSFIFMFTIFLNSSSVQIKDCSDVFLKVF